MADTASKLQEVADDDVRALLKAQESYGDSWKRRGGVGAFMMLARKWDRLENAMVREMVLDRYDIFDRTVADMRPEGLIDDIRDMRRYLMLVEAELRARGTCPGLLPKDSVKKDSFTPAVVAGLK